MIYKQLVWWRAERKLPSQTCLAGVARATTASASQYLTGGTNLTGNKNL